MEILNYKKAKGNLYEVTFDNGGKYKIYDDIILKYELLITKNITPKKFKEMLEENEKLDAYYRALKYISIKMRSEKEIETYLKKCDFNSENIAYTIEKLKKEGYINQDSYADIHK